IVDNRLNLFNTDITDNEYSDGIIVNMQGQVIGIITHTLKEGLNEEISTAIGISKIMPIIQRLVNNEDRIYFGIHGEDLPEEILEQAGIENGIYVNEVEAGSPALQAGIMSGDMIVRIGNTPITSMTTFYNTISTYNVRDSVQVLVRRQSQGSFRDVTVTVELAKKEG
ncbi:MAG TPA: PDZ domain-containing protein, partial [Candidatus Caccomorpha excrementavium]|nr:PDZ domain-containing protein [Candidatus Caccomorpha excrementavium]